MASQDDKTAADVQQLEDADLEAGSKDKPASGNGHIEGNALLLNKSGEIRRIPVPSSDPNDPLNFQRWEKYVVVFCCCWFSIIGLSMASGLGSILSVFYEMYGSEGYGSDQITFLITLPTLCIGLGNFIILPLGLAFGRRPVFLISMLIMWAATLSAATQNSYNGHLASRIIQGLSAGASESLLPLMLTEVTFLHERSRIFALYWTVQNGLSSVFNLSASYLNDTFGWRSYYWLFVITLSIGLFIAFLFGFETQFTRPAASLDGQLVVTDEFGTTRVIADSEAQQYLEEMERSGMGPPSAGGSSTGSIPRKKTYLQRIKPWSKPHPQPVKAILVTWLHMLQSLSSPGIIFAVLSSSIVLGSAVGMSLTYDAVLRGYGWASRDIGLVNVGGVIGAVMGMLYCDFLGSPFVLWVAGRNRGVHLPEHHLLTMVPPAILAFAMLLLYGFTASGGATWWGPYMGWTIFQYSFTAVLIISTSFASEVAPKHPGPALVVVVGTKNIVSFGVTYGLTPMINENGYKWAFGVLAGIAGAIFLLGIPVYLLNPKWRSMISRREASKGVNEND